MEFLTDFSISFFDHLQKNGQQNGGHFCVFFWQILENDGSIFK